MHIHPLTNIDLPELQPYRTLRRSQEHYAKGIFIAEGEKVVTRLLESRLRIRSLLISDEWFDRKKDDLTILTPPPEVYVGPKRLLADVVGYNLHQGIMALAELPTPPKLSSILETTRRPHICLAIDDLTNAENVGMIVRNARAFGVTCIIVGETSSSPYLRRAVRNSLGTVFFVPVFHTPDLPATLRSMSSDHALSVLAAETNRGGAPIHTTDLTGDVCLVVGGEALGIREHVLRECDQVVEIPMVGGMDSVNVANATAICLYEVRRQRIG